jgi:hypothetical protein
MLIYFPHFLLWQRRKDFYPIKINLHSQRGVGNDWKRKKENKIIIRA